RRARPPARPPGVRTTSSTRLTARSAAIQSAHARMLAALLSWYLSRMQTYQGGCHCGRVRFRVTADLDRVTECNCSMCRKKGFLHLIVAPEQFELTSGPGELSTYQFGPRTAKHHFCRHCGISSFYIPRSDPDKIDVNVRCLDGVEPSTLRIFQFDGRN